MRRLLRKTIGRLFKAKLIVFTAVGILVLSGGVGYAAMREMAIINQAKTSANRTTGDTGQISSKTQDAKTKTTSNSSATATGKTTSTSTPTKSTSSTTATAKTTTTSTSTSGTATNTTPTPPPSSGGGNLSNGSCFGVPSSCGYPDATNSGPVAGTVFTKVPEQATSGNGWNWDATNQYMSVYGSNITLNGIVTSGNIDITGSNVTLQNCKVTEANGMFGVSLRHTTNVTVKNCNIAGTNASTGRTEAGIKSIYGDDVGMRTIANNVSYVSTGIQHCQGLIQDNYIHDLGFQSGDHLNGTTSNSGCNQLTIQHNTIFNSFDQTDAISLFEDFGAQANALITNNYLAGGGYTIYGGANSGGATPINIQITNNRISDHYYANGGYYGWLAAWNGAGSGNVCSGNVLEHTATGKIDALGC